MRTSFIVVVLLAVSVCAAQWLETTIPLPDSLGYLRNTTVMVENPLTGRTYVCSGTGVMLVDGATGDRVGLFRVSGKPVYCAGTDRVCVLTTDSVLVFDARADTFITGTNVAWFNDAAYSPETRRLYLFRTRTYPADVRVFDVATATVTDTVPFDGWFHEAVWDSVTNRLFFTAGEDSSGVLVYDCATDSFVGRAWYGEHYVGYIALDPGLRKLYLTFEEGDTIVIIDPDSIAEVGRVPVPVVHGFRAVERKTHRLFYKHDTTTVVFDCRGESVRTVLDDIDPLSLDWDRGNGEVYVAPIKQGGVAVIDTFDNIDRWLLADRGDTFVSLALNGNANTLYAALAVDTLFLVDPQSGSVQNATVALYLRVGGLLHNPAGNVLYAFCYNKNAIAAIGRDGTVTGYIEGLQFGNDLNMVLNPVLNRLYVAGDSVLGVVDCNTMQVIHIESLPHFEETAMLLLADPGKLYLFPRNFSDSLGHCLRVFDCWSNTILAERALPDEVPHAVYHPAAGLIYFCCRDTPSVRVLDPVTDSVVRTLCVSAGTHADDRLEVDLGRGRVLFSSVSDDRVVIIDALTSTVLDSVELPRDVDTLIMNHEQDKLYMLRLASSGRFYVYDCAADSLLPERDFDPNYVALLNVRNDKLFFESDLGLRAVDCRYDSMVGYWPEGVGIRSLAWNAIDNRVYAARRGPEILVLADNPTGVRESPSEARAPYRLCPTIVRGVLRLPGDMTEFRSGESALPKAGAGPLAQRVPSHVLLDIAGRKVMDLLPGENDVRGVAPGVYFVRAKVEGGGLRDEPELGRRLPAVWKVVIQR